MRMRYHKYKGRYSDLARHYKELEREREKVKVGTYLHFCPSNDNSVKRFI